jgi:hypothetical protein
MADTECSKCRILSIPSYLSLFRQRESLKRAINKECRLIIKTKQPTKKMHKM